MNRNLLALLVAASLSGAVNASPYYLRSTVGAPWGVTTNEIAMDSAFGSGNWVDARYETVNTASLFSATTNFIFMEGGDNNADELESFLGANSAAISSWVNSGGRLFVNAAPNEGNGMSFGFGVTLTYPEFTGANNATAVNPAHPIFSGVATAYTGSSFSHAIVSGAGLTPLINDGTGDAVLASMQIGSGFGMFGGMTTTNFHAPGTDAFELRVNILEYAANVRLAAVPEPGTLALLGLGLFAAAGLRHRKSKPVVMC